MPEIETVKVFWSDKGPGMFTINASDFDPQIHKRSEDQVTPARSPDATQPTTAQRRKREK